MNFERFFTLITIGFNCCFSMYFLFKYFTEKKHPYYLYIILLSMAYSFDMAFTDPFFSSHFPYLNVALMQVVCVNLAVLFFYLFLVHFLDFSSVKWLRHLLRFGSFYMGLAVTCRVLQFWIPGMNELGAIILRPTFVYIHFLILFSVLFCLIRIRKGYPNYTLVAIVAIIVFAILIQFSEKLQLALSKNIIRQLMLIVSFSLFFLAILKKEKDAEIENQRLKNKFLLRELKRQKSLQTERQRISHDMHDELGAGISALKLQAEFLKKKVTDESLKEDVNDLLKISEDMNIAMREILWSLNADNDNVKNFIQYIQSYAEVFFAKTAIHLVCRDHPFLLPEVPLGAVYRRQLLLCLKEAFNNTYKHSHAHHLELSCSYYDNKLIIDIADDGIGLPTHLSADTALPKVRKRMQNIGGTLDIIPSEKGLHIRLSSSTV